MKKIFITCFLFVCLATKGFSYGGDCAQGCCQDPCCCFELSAEWLYMQACNDQPFFAIEQIGINPNGTRFANEQRWHSGYRIEAIYHIPCMCCQDYLKARWTHFPEFKNSRTVSGDLEAILNHPDNSVQGVGTASIKDEFTFYKLDLLWGRPVYCNCCLHLAFEAGLQWAKINFDEDVEYFLNVISLVENRSELNGIGPEVALNLSYDFCRCFAFKGRAEVAFLVNKRKAKFFENFENSSEIYFADNDPYWYGTPALNFRFGFNYHHSLCFCRCDNVNINIEVGYEFIHFIKGVDRIYFVDNLNEGSSFVQHQDFTLHGPYVHLGVCF